MIRLTIIILLSIISIKTYSCKCGPITLQDNFNSAEFVATAKIIEIKPDSLNKDLHNIEIEIINLYKGEKPSRLSIYSMLNSSCAFYTEKSTTWLIFARKFNGILSFGYCSGSLQIDRKFDESNYPGVTSNYKSSIDLKLSVLNWIKQNKINLKNNLQIQVSRSSKRIEDLKGYKGKNKDFAIVEYTLEKNFSLKKVRLAKKFKNNSLNNALKKASADEFKASHKSLKTLPQPVKLFAIYYFYPQERNDKSFISVWDV